MRTQNLVIKGVSHIILLFFSIATTYPLLWMLFSSLKSQAEFYTNLWWIPKAWLWENYTIAWKTAKLSTTYWNSIVVTLASIVLVVLFSYLGAYSFARFDSRFNKILMLIFLSALMIPGQITLIPLFKVELLLGVYNTKLGLILPAVAGGMPFSIFLLATFIRSIPRELDEAAEIDGASRMGILWKIVFPLSRPGMATVVILTFIGVWNDFFLALVMIKDPANYTIPLGMMAFTQQFSDTNYSEVFAALTATVLPMIIIYLIFQRFFISGLTQGALKL
jgi:raffinose/stachyose/melibiose transport system permease protein